MNGRRNVQAIVLTLGLGLGLMQSAAVTAEGTPMAPVASQKLTGTVSAIKSGLVVVHMLAGKLRLQAKAGLSDVKIGDEITVWVNEDKFVMAVQKKGAPAPVHRLVSGKLTWASDNKNDIKLWTPDGEKTFAVERGRSKLNTLKEGAQITIELNESGKVIDVHSVSMSISVDPGTGPAGSRIKMTGVVSKIQSDVVTVKTPTAQLNLSQKRGLGDVKVGDEVTVWVNENNVVMSVQKQGASEPVHRLVSGTLISISDNQGDIKVSTPDGEKAFAVVRNRSKLSMMKAGTAVTIELDETGKVIDMRKAG